MLCMAGQSGRGVVWTGEWLDIVEAWPEAVGVASQRGRGQEEVHDGVEVWLD